jgi:hypothetical protein
VTLAAFDTDALVATAYDRAFVGRLASSGVAIAPAPRAYDGVAGSEAFWLSMADPDVVRAHAVGHVVTLSVDGVERRLVLLDVRPLAEAAHEGRRPAFPHIEAREDHTYLDTPSPDAPHLGAAAVHATVARTFVVVAREVHAPAAEDIHLLVRDGVATMLPPPNHRSL